MEMAEGFQEVEKPVGERFTYVDAEEYERN